MSVELLDPLQQIAPAPALAQEPVPTSVDTLPVAETPEVLDPQQRKEQLKARVDHAKMECGFDYVNNPEIGEALEGFYEDHYELADLISSALDGTTSDEQLDAIAGREDNLFNEDYLQMLVDGLDKEQAIYAPSTREMTHVLASVIKHEKTADGTVSPRLTKALATALTYVFEESSLGAITIDEPELAMVKSLHTRLKDTVIEQADPAAELKDNGEVEWRSKKGLTHIVLPSEESLMARIKHAQQEFWDDTRMGGQLLFHNTGQLDGISRAGALMPRTEQFRRTGTMRAQMRVDDRMHSVVPHWAENYDPSLLYKIGEHQGTVAVPLAEIVRQAPFARDAEYTTVRVSDKEGILPRVPVSAGTKGLTSGNHDHPGQGGPDRVFFASGTQNGDQAPDAYAIPMNERATLIFNGDEELKHSMMYGLGEGFPQRVAVDGLADAEAKALELQAASLERYKDWVVIPLRRGVFDYQAENMSNSLSAGRPAPNYNANPVTAEAA